jgi:hypothetical protein
MSLAIAPDGIAITPTTTAADTFAFTPTAFSQRLLEAAASDARRDERDRTQLASLLRPFANEELDGRAFEVALLNRQHLDGDLGHAAREVLALWLLCSRFAGR